MQQYYQQWNELHSPRGTDKTILQGRLATQAARRAIISSSLPDIAKLDLYSSIDEMDDILDSHHDSSSKLPKKLLEDICSASGEIEGAVQDQSVELTDLTKKTKAKTALVQELSRQMRSL